MTQLELPFDVDALYNQVLPLPPQVRGIIFAVAKMRGEAFTPLKTLQRVLGVEVTGMANENTCTSCVSVLELKGSRELLLKLVEVFTSEETKEINIRNLNQYKYEKEMH